MLVDIQFSPCHLLKGLSFPHFIFSVILLKCCWPIYMGLLQGSLFCSIGYVSVFMPVLVQVQCFFIDFLPGWSIHCWKWNIKSPTCIVLLYISPVSSVNICFVYFGAPMLGGYIFIILISSWFINPFIIQWPFLYLVTVFDLRCLVWYTYRYFCFILHGYIFPSLHFQPVLQTQVGLL